MCPVYPERCGEGDAGRERSEWAPTKKTGPRLLPLAAFSPTLPLAQTVELRSAAPSGPTCFLSPCSLRDLVEGQSLRSRPAHSPIGFPRGAPEPFAQGESVKGGNATGQRSNHQLNSASHCEDLFQGMRERPDVSGNAERRSVVSEAVFCAITTSFRSSCSSYKKSNRLVRLQGKER